MQLWSIVILVIVVLTAGMLALVLPNVIWAQRVIRIEHVYLPQLFFGLISLVLLFNIYLVGQKITLNNTRRALISELVLNERLESLSLIDPLTQLLNRRAMNELIPREVARANRLSSHLDFPDHRPRRFSRHQFQVWQHRRQPGCSGNLPDYSPPVFEAATSSSARAETNFSSSCPIPAKRTPTSPSAACIAPLEQWNLNSGKSYQLAFSWGLAAYVTGSEVEDVLRAVDRQLYQKKHNLVPVF